MKSSYLLYISIILLILGLIISFISIESEQIMLFYYNESNIAYPQPGWQDYYWSVLVYGNPNATIITFNETIILKNVNIYHFNTTTRYVYIIHGYIQPYAYLSPFSLFLVLTASFIGFKGTTLFFQSRILGEELTKGYAVGGSLYRYVLKRFSSFLISIILVITVVIILESLHGRNIIKTIYDMSLFNLGNSSYFGISVTSLVLTALAYTSLLLGISFALTVYLSAFLSIYSLTNRRLRNIIDKWKYIGTALASWVLSIIVIYFLHFFLNIFPYGTPKENIFPYLFMPLISLFFPYVGIFSNRLLSNVKSIPANYKGLKETILIYRHLLGNVTVVMLSSISSAFIEMLLAEMLVEGIFLWPGLGELLKIAIFHGDYKIVEGVMVLYSTIALLSNLITDIIYGIMDPRVTR
ncbi:ABC transporter permease subunit [Sulfurisphaera ohwakuensis]|uniref:ABC transporter permease subunit n=1 Tax=Sulfurisphaera ohwakuensis TaxID=69656 RepID=UPI0036F22400